MMRYKPPSVERGLLQGKKIPYLDIPVIHPPDPSFVPVKGRWNAPNHQSELFCPVYLMKFDKIVNCNIRNPIKKRLHLPE
jgi:hypothetical protein